MCCWLGGLFQQWGRVSCYTAWHKRCQLTQCGLQTVLELLPEGIFHHPPQIPSDQIMGAHNAMELDGVSGDTWQWSPTSTHAILHCECNRESNRTTSWCFCLPTCLDRSHVQLSGPTTAWRGPCHPCSPHLHSGGKNPACYGDMQGFETMWCKALGKCKWQPGH